MAPPAAKPAQVPSAVGGSAAVLPVTAQPAYVIPDATFTPPTGWTTKNEPGEPFPSLFGPAGDPGSPYVVIKAIRDSKDPFALGDATIKVLTKNPGFQLNLRDAFQTADEQFGLKFVLAVSMDKAASGPAGSGTSAPAPTPASSLSTATYRQAYYLIQGPPGTVYVILATVPEAGWSKYGRILDEMAESWRLTPKGEGRRG